MANRGTHQAVGAFAGAAVSYLSAQDQPTWDTLIEIAGGAFAGFHLARLPDLIDPPVNPNHRGFGHAIVPNVAGGGYLASKVSEWQQVLRQEASDQARLRQESDSTLWRAWHTILELLMRLLSGALAGALGGYGSHVALDSTTPKGLPVFVKGF